MTLSKAALSTGIFGLACLGLISCEPDVVEDSGPTTQYTHVYQLLESQAPKIETFTIDATQGAALTTDRGSKIIIDPSSLQYQNGMTVTGNVTVKMQEIFTRKDMFTTGVTTVSNDEVLVSGGAYNLSITQGGDRLQTNPNFPIRVQIPAQATDPNMQLFVGTDLGNGSSNSWQLPDSTSLAKMFGPNDGIYTIMQTELGWVNCDAFTNVGMVNNVSLHFIGNPVFNYQNTVVVCYSNTVNSLYYPWTSATTQFTNSVYSDIRLPNVQQYVVGLSLINGKIYLGITRITPSPGVTYPIIMNEVTEADVIAFLNSL